MHNKHDSLYKDDMVLKCRNIMDVNRKDNPCTSIIKAKFTLDNNEQERKTLLKAIVIEEGGQNSVWTPLHWNKGQGHFKR